MTIIGEAYVRVRPDDDGFEKEAESKVGGTIKKLAAAAGAAFAARAVFNFGKGAFEAAQEANKIAAQTEAVIKSTGGAAGTTAKQISDLAEAISKKTGVDDEAIQSGSNLLLTFTNIRNEAGKGNDVFNRATSTLTDMAAALGTDVSGSAVQLGKALNDPIKGIAALSRVGVTFTDQQKEMIKGFVESGQVAKAQGVILDELGKEFGGSAEAQATAADKFKVIMGNLQEDIGNKLVPVVNTVLGLLAGALPRALEFLGGVFTKVATPIRAFIAAVREGDVTSDGFVGVLETIGDAIHRAIPTIERIIALIGDNLPAAGAAVAAVIATVVVPAFVAWAAAAIPAAVATIAAAAPALALAAAVGALAAGIVYAYQNFEGFRNVVDTVVAFLTDKVLPRVQEFAAFLMEKIGEAVEFIVAIWPQIQEAIGHVLAVVRAIIEAFVSVVGAAWDRFGSNIMSVVGVVFETVRSTIENAINVVRGIIQLVLALINGDWGKAWDALKGIVAAVFDQVGNVIRGAGGLLLEALKFVVEGTLTAATFLPRKFVEFAGDLIGGLVQGIKDKAGDVIAAIKEFVLDKVPGFVKKFFGIDSPSKLMAGFGRDTVEGFLAGLREAGSKIDDELARTFSVPAVNVSASITGGAAAAPNVVALQPTIAIEQTFGPGTNAADVKAAMVDVAQSVVVDALDTVVERALAGAGRA